MGRFGFIGRGARAAFNWLWYGTTAGKAAKVLNPKNLPVLASAVNVTGKITPMGSRVAGLLWRVGSVGLNTLFIYDMWRNWDSENPEANSGLDAETASQVIKSLFEDLIPTEVAIAFDMDITDTKSVAHAYRNHGLSLVSEQLDKESMRGFSYVAFAEYISDYEDTPKRQPDAIASILRAELTQFYNTIQKQDGWDFLATISEISEITDSLNLDGAPTEIIRRYDFLCFLLEHLNEMDEDTSDRKQPVQQSADRLETVRSNNDNIILN